MTNLLLIIFAVIQAWDVFTTNDAIKRGYGRESNPMLGFLNRFSEDTGFWMLVVRKGLLVAVFGGLVWGEQFCQGYYADWPLPEWTMSAFLGGLILYYVKPVVIGNTKLWFDFHFNQKR